MTGFEAAKEMFADIKQKVEYVEAGGDHRMLETCLNMIVVGSPGAELGNPLARSELSFRGHRHVIDIWHRRMPTAAGTGKTSFARLLFRFLRAYGVLTRDSFVEKNALELKAEYVGHTAPRVKAAVEDALGGCLFLDEAYSLAGDCSFSKEAVRTLLTEVENNRTGLLVVLAGYKEKMGKLMRMDPGLPRRFPRTITLPDYTAAQV